MGLARGKFGIYRNRKGATSNSVCQKFIRKWKKGKGNPYMGRNIPPSRPGGVSATLPGNTQKRNFWVRVGEACPARLYLY